MQDKYLFVSKVRVAVESIRKERKQ